MTVEHESLATDLSTCDREPIHIPGSVQPHGALLALREADLSVIACSDNVERHLERTVPDVLGRALAEVLGSAWAEAIRDTLRAERLDEHNPILLRRDAATFDAIIHRHDGLVMIELEPAPAAAEPAGHHPLRPALQAIQHAETLPQLCDEIVGQVRRITGFERAMVYRFDDAGHGFVQAEAKSEALQPYLGLHYPASDIPQQARELYRRNWLRIIPDARYLPSAIVPQMRPDTGGALDLSHSVLRSVSPIHLEYLANMGVRASMSASILVRDELWGLISCLHHSQPRFVRYEVRAAVEMLARLASLQISAMEDREAARQRLLRRDAHLELAGALRSAPRTSGLLAAMIDHPGAILGIVDADGAAVVGPYGVRCCGKTPPADVVAGIAAALGERGGGAPFATTSLAQLMPEAEAHRDTASGLLALALPGSPPRRLLWFRGEVVQTVSWGGDPHKPVQVDPSMRIHPRRSFEQWKEAVRLQSQPWTASDVEAAEELRRIAVEVDLERQVESEQRAVRARDDLVAVVSHDLRTPLNVIQMQAAVLLTMAEEDPTMRRLRASAERVQRAIDRMNALLRDLLDLGKIEAGRFQVRLRHESAAEMIRESLQIVRPLAEAKGIVVDDEASEGLSVHADRERVFQVLSNLLSNAVKFTPPAGRIVVRAEAHGGEVRFCVADSGPGIAPDQLLHIFDRYWQARTTADQGTGLGLYISKGIVEAHGGSIWAESEPGAGAQIHFTLPAV